VDALIRLVAGLGPWAYVVILVGATLESAAFLGLLVPGEALALASGVLAHSGALDLGAVVAAVAVGAVIGDNIGYELGRRLGRPWLLAHGDRFGVDDEMIERAERVFEQHGGKALVLGRFVGVLRALAPFVAGASRMPYATFLVFNALGGIAWALSVVLLGAALGQSWDVAERWLGRLETIVGALALIAVVVLWRRRARPA